MLQHFLMSWYY